MGSEKHSNQRSNYPQTLLDIKCFNFRFFLNQSTMVSWILLCLYLDPVLAALMLVSTSHLLTPSLGGDTVRPVGSYLQVSPRSQTICFRQQQASRAFSSFTRRSPRNSVFCMPLSPTPLSSAISGAPSFRPPFPSSASFSV